MFPLTLVSAGLAWAVSGVDADGDGYPVPEDCDDTDPLIYPGAPERCNGLDDNCDGNIDEGWETRWVPDNDMDGSGQDVKPLVSCYFPKFEPPGGGSWASPATIDCDDNDPLRSPLRPEMCNGIDNNCNGIVDDVTDPRWMKEVWPDQDRDGYGAVGRRELGCPSDGWVEITGDCDDTDPAVNPDAVDRCTGIDDDCDGEIDEDCVDRAPMFDPGCSCGSTTPAPGLLLIGLLAVWTRARVRVRRRG